MRSIPQALMWELLVHGRWSLIGGALAANLTPALLLFALSSQGPIDHEDSSYFLLCVMLMCLHLCVFGAAVFQAQGHPSRLYTAPVPTATLVTWHMVPGTLLIATELVLSTWVLNAVFHVDWPLWGPALFVVAAFPAMQAAAWQTEKSPWQPLALGIVAGCLELWFKSRFGPTFDVSNHFWMNITAGEVATVTVIAAGSYFVAAAGIARTRRGDTLGTPKFFVWLMHIFDHPGRIDQPFQSADQAQLWFEWRQKGWAIPACIIGGLVVGIGSWTLFNRHPQELFQGFLTGGGLLSVVAFIGSICMGNTGSSEKIFEMSQFLASRPMTTQHQSHIILKMAALSIGLAWSIWAVAFLTFYLTVLASGVTLQLPFPVRILWLYFPATLLGPWIVATAGTSLGLIGRRTVFIELICGGLALFIGMSFLSEYALSRENRLFLSKLVTESIGVLLVLGTVWAMIVAQQRKMIRWSAVFAAAGLWMIATILIVLFELTSLNYQHPILLMIGLLALAVAPIATAPLALASNRNR